MKKAHYVMAALVASLTLSLAWANKDHEMKPITGSAELEMMKTLEGHWEGTHTMDGKELPAVIDYKVTANGSAVIETMGPGTPHEMVTMYYDDPKGKITMTHYCALGNQPVMDLKKAKGNVLEFKFAKKKNIINPRKEMHMHAMTLDKVDKDTVKYTWTMYKDGKESSVSNFELTRQ